MTDVDQVVTDAQLEVIRLTAQGLTRAAVARRIGITSTGVSMRLARAGQALGTTTTIETVLECERRGLLGAHTHRPQQVRREVADRHAASCALLRPPACDCTATPPSVRHPSHPVHWVGDGRG